MRNGQIIWQRNSLSSQLKEIFSVWKRAQANGLNIQTGEKKEEEEENNKKTNFFKKRKGVKEGKGLWHLARSSDQSKSINVFIFYSKILL